MMLSMRWLQFKLEDNLTPIVGAGDKIYTDSKGIPFTMYWYKSGSLDQWILWILHLL